MRHAMKTALIVAAAWMVVGCGMEPVFGERNVDPDLEHYVSDYEDRFDVKVDFRVEFGEPRKDHWRAQCVRSGVFGRKVVFDRDRWSEMSDLDRYWSSYHELSHCACDVDHFNATFEDGSPVSIMHEGGKSGGAHLRGGHASYYFEELTDRIRTDGDC